MNKWFKVLVTVVVVIVLIILGGIGYLRFFFPKVGAAPEFKIDATPEMVARGEYLANHVSVCLDCHSSRDWDFYAGPIIQGTEGKGGELFGKKDGFPGDFYAANITPYSLGDWTDGEIYRLITTGVKKDGNPVFPIMPYPEYAQMDPADVKSIIAYLRTLPAIKNNVPRSEAAFPMSLIMRTFPQPAALQSMPEKSDTVSYGRYIATIAGCAGCHTLMEKGKPLPGMELAGGMEFGLPGGGVVRSANITPDDETGIGAWTKADFIRRFSSYADPGAREKVKAGGMNTVMPWFMYSGMTEEDLGAIYAYLQTVTPAKHVFDQFTPPAGD